jgi:hypothetical protein
MNRTTTRLIITVGVTVSLAACGGNEPDDDDTGIANPASVYCEEQGGVVEIVDESDGQVGYCVLPDGRRIEEWLFFRSGGTTTQP